MFKLARTGTVWVETLIVIGLHDKTVPIILPFEFCYDLTTNP